MATSTNYGWAEPDNSSLVKNGASDIRTLGNAIDTSLWNSGYGQAGKNKLINGDFKINQRGFSSTTSSATYMFDRWNNFLSDGTVTYSSQSFTLGTAPVAGYEGSTFLRCVTTGQTAAGAAALLFQKIESVRTFANQTVTISFWAKAAAGTPKVALELGQNFGTGGSPSASVNTYVGQVTLSTSWVRYSASIALPSIAGKTLGTVNDDNLGVNFWTSAGTTFNSRTGSLGIQSATIDFWGVQIEYGSYATPFQTATGSLGGELALAQRYYSKTYNQSEAPGYSPATSGFNGINASTTLVVGIPVFKVSMRTSPTITLYSPATGTSGKIRSGGADVTATAADVGENGIGYISATGLTAGSNSTICYVASAEL